MNFPVTRMRRYRKNSKIRDIVRETKLNKEDLIYPIFVKEDLKDGEKEEAISFFKEYIRHIRESNGCSTYCAEGIAKDYFSFYASYCDEETIKMVKENFCVSTNFF
jgi:delta-aminolevulinic acid dehydratase/porphobilinogen synthase